MGISRSTNRLRVGTNTVIRHILALKVRCRIFMFIEETLKLRGLDSMQTARRMSPRDSYQVSSKRPLRKSGAREATSDLLLSVKPMLLREMLQGAEEGEEGEEVEEQPLRSQILRWQQLSSGWMKKK